MECVEGLTAWVRLAQTKQITLMEAELKCPQTKGLVLRDTVDEAPSPEINDNVDVPRHDEWQWPTQKQSIGICGQLTLMALASQELDLHFCLFRWTLCESSLTTTPVITQCFARS